MGVPHGNQLGGRGNDQGISALQIVHGRADSCLNGRRAQPFPNQKVCDDFGIRGGVENGALLLQHPAQFHGVGEVPVVGKGHAALEVIDHQGLGVQGGIGAGGGVTDVSHSDLAGSKALQPLPGKCLACQPHTPPDGEHPIVVHGNASTLLAAVLEGKEPVIGKGRNIRRLRREQAEHAALLM